MSCKCDGLGIVRAINTAQNMDVLMKCDCDAGKQQNWPLPVKNHRIESLEFEIQRCPLAWFLPDNERESVKRGDLVVSVFKKGDEWLTRIRESVKFWEKWDSILNKKPLRGHWQEKTEEEMPF